MNKKSLLLHMGVFAALTIILWLGLVAAAALPNELIAKNMTKSAYYYKDVDGFSFEYGNKWYAIADNYADSILLNISYNMGRGNPFISSLDTRYYSGGGLGENVGLFLTVDENVPPDTDYTRYWHGSGGILRILHLFSDVGGIKKIGLFIMLVLAVITFASIIRRKNYKTAVSLLAAMCAVHIWNIGLSLEYQSVFILCFLLCPLYLYFERMDERALSYLSVAGGTMTAFFDFLTCETVVILMPLILVLAVRIEEKRFGGRKKEAALIIKCLLCFGLSYGGAFLVKWALASIVTGENKFVAAFAKAAVRVSGDNVEISSNPLIRMVMAVAANLSVLFGGTIRTDLPRVLAGLCLCLAVGGSLWYLFLQKKKTEGKELLLLLGGIVFLRYMILSNHSGLHGFFTYRALMAPVTAVMFVVLSRIQLPEKKGRVKRRA